jgi:Protein of unknown function (DUF4231)
VIPPWRRRPHPVLLSDRGFFELAAEPDLPLREQFTRFRALVSSDMDWVDSRKDRFRARASWAKVFALVLTAASTVVLGLTGIPDRAAIALPMVALVTVISALEPFFNWRSRWILMEEAQYRLNRLRDEMDYYLVTTPTGEMRRAALERFFREQQDIWSDVSKQWIEYRRPERIAEGQPGGQIAN